MSPLGQFDQFLGRAVACDLGDRFQLGNRDLGLVVQAQDPPADPAAVQLDPHDRSDPDIAGQVVRNHVVERLVEPGDVWQHPRDRWP